MHKAKGQRPDKIPTDWTHKNRIFKNDKSIIKVKQRIYIYTSVFGGHFDEEFKEHTIPLFERIKEGEFIILYSKVTQEELEKRTWKSKRTCKKP